VFVDTAKLLADPDRIEEIEKASARLVTQAIYEFRDTAAQIFSNEPDLPQDIAEDVTREALDRLGASRIDVRLFGKIDYKRARYVFHPSYAVRQALLVDSKAEKEHGTSTLQTAQTSMRIRHVRAGKAVDERGTLPSRYKPTKEVASRLPCSSSTSTSTDPKRNCVRLRSLPYRAAPFRRDTIRRRKRRYGGPDVTRPHEASRFAFDSCLIG